jgi:outer membrane protein, heavy metal efflux system
MYIDFFPFCISALFNNVRRARTLFFITGTTILSASSTLAETIRLNAAINRAFEAAQISELNESVRQETESYREAATALPNPSLFYERESLEGGPMVQDSRERTIGLSAPLDFIWKRGSRIEAAGQRGKVSLLQFEEQRRQLSREVAVLFVEFDANRLRSERHEAVHVVLDRAKFVAQASVTTGDAAPTLLQRVDLAIARHAFEENHLQSDRLSILGRFSAILASDTVEPDSASFSLESPHFQGEFQAGEAARLNRPDLKAAEALFGWKQAERDAVRREGLPEVSVEAGRKEDNAGRDGLFLGLAVELPIFERNQAASGLAAARSRQAEIAYHQAIRLVEAEARSAFNRWQKLHQNWRRLSSGLEVTRNAESLLASAEASFEAGEYTLLEYLDTVEAYLEAAEQEIELERSLRLAVIELAHATATPIKTN